jgi:hypothetical protein
MTWLVKLYPRRFRERYGSELVELIAAKPFSVRTSVDLIAGAIDAWIHPQLLTAVQATPDAQGATTMMARLMKLECAGYGSTVTPSDVKKSLAITLGGTVVLMLGWWWVRQTVGRNEYVTALSINSFLVPYVFSMRYTSLKGRSSGVQATFIFGLTFMLVMLSLLAGWIGAR